MNVFQKYFRPEQELPSICWIYPVCGIPLEGEVPFESSPLGVVHCEAGCQLEKKVDIQLTGCVPGNQDRKGQDGGCQFAKIPLF